jgi:hypothetical protein
MSLINRLLQRISGQSRHYRARRHTAYSPFGIQAAQVQVLENRRLLSALTVTTAADSGAGSLRAEIAAAKSGDTINFASSLKGHTITLTSGELLINKGLTIQGPGAAQLTISGGHASRVFDVTSSQLVTLTGLTISNGSTASNSGGGGIFNSGTLTINVCTIVGSTAYIGGGICNTGTLTISGSSLTNDHASYYGGGILNRGALTLSQCTISGSSSRDFGGGIDNSGSLTATGCTISHDTTALGFTVDGEGGGGIYTSGTLAATGCTVSFDSATHGVGGGIDAKSGRTTLTNCTLAGNFAAVNVAPYVYVSGGGLYVGGGLTYVTNCTVSGNHVASGVGGGIGVEDGVALSLLNTIVAGNTSEGFGEQVSGADIYDLNDGGSGPELIADHDLIGNGSGIFSIRNGVNGNIVGGFGNPVINALLGPLQNNGGPTMTMALLAGSPAIGQANSALAPTTDQRGVTRRDLPGELTDIGTFEV